MSNLKDENVIFFYNTLGHSVQKFIPLEENTVRMYTCGPTVYGRAHIGNMRAYVFADTVKRVLLYAGYKVKHVMNITDVGHLSSDADEGEDKLAKAARENHESAWNISKKWTEQFFKDTKSLHIMPVDVACKATEHIEEQIALIKTLEVKGFTYLTSDGLYYDTSKFPRYADFACLDIDGLQAGKRIEMGAKRNKTDFALWKFSKSDEKRDMEWDSPWGIGFPGWHLECSAMSMKYLGETFDIHTGGIDHIPIHHTNEIAQSEGATGKKFVNYWLHCEFLTMSNSEKMSKSLGNVVNIDTLIENGINPLSFRYMCLNANFKKQLLYSKEILVGCNTAYLKLCNIYKQLKEQARIIDIANFSERANSYLVEFRKSIYNNLGTPQAMAVMWNMLKDALLTPSEKLTLLEDFDKVFAILPTENEELDLPSDVIELLKQRDECRKNKQWKDSDVLREQLISMGYVVLDTKEGTKVVKQ